MEKIQWQQNHFRLPKKQNTNKLLKKDRMNNYAIYFVRPINTRPPNKNKMLDKPDRKTEEKNERTNEFTVENKQNVIFMLPNN